MEWRLNEADWIAALTGIIDFHERPPVAGWLHEPNCSSVPFSMALSSTCLTISLSHFFTGTCFTIDRFVSLSTFSHTSETTRTFQGRDITRAVFFPTVHRDAAWRFNGTIETLTGSIFNWVCQQFLEREPLVVTLFLSSAQDDFHVFPYQQLVYSTSWPMPSGRSEYWKKGVILTPYGGWIAVISFQSCSHGLLYNWTS